MNVNPDSLPDADDAVTEGGELAVKPVRRRRTVKSIDAGTAVLATSSTDPGEAAALAEPVEAVSRPRRRKPSAAPTEPLEPAAEGESTPRPRHARIDPINITVAGEDTAARSAPADEAAARAA